MKPWIMWIWNRTITRERIIEQMHSFSEKGVGGAAIKLGREMSPRYGSEEFFSLFETVCFTARTLKIGIRLAEDFGFSLNPALQDFVLERRDNRAHCLVCEQTHPAKGGESVEISMEDPDQTYLFAARTSEGRISAGHIKKIPVIRSRNPLSWKAPAGEWVVFVLRKKEVRDTLGAFMLNLNNGKALQAYTAAILEPFRSRYHTYLSFPFEGFLFEMPSFSPREKSVLWDDDLGIKFRAKYRKSILEYLPLLFWQVDSRSLKSRAQVFEFMYQAMFDRFQETVETWAKKNRTNIWVCAAGRDNGSREGRNLFFNVPGASLGAMGIRNETGVRQNYPHWRFCADMNLLHYRRESLCIVGRNLSCNAASLQSLKNDLDTVLLDGGATCIIDGCFFNDDRSSYGSTPLNPSWYAPEWAFAGSLFEYATRLKALSSGYAVVRDVAVLVPSSVLFSEYSLTGEKEADQAFTAIDAVVDALSRSGCAFDVIGEEFLSTCSVFTNGEFGTAARIRKGNYKVLIIPHARFLAKQVFLFLEKLVARKGSVIIVGEHPQGNLDDGDSASVLARIGKILSSRHGTARVVGLQDLSSCAAQYPPPVEIRAQGRSCPDIAASVGSSRENELYLLRGTSETKETYATIGLPDSNHLYYVDCAGGNIYEIRNGIKNEGMLRFPLHVSPGQSYAFIGSKLKEPSVATEHKTAPHPIFAVWTRQRSYRVVLKNQWSFSPQSLNILPLSSWNTRIGLSRQTGGFSHLCESYFEVRDLPSLCFLYLHGLFADDMAAGAPDRACEVSLNGTVIDAQQRPDEAEANALEHTPLLRDYFARDRASLFSIHGLMKRGYNRLSLRTVCAVSDPITIAYPPLLAGTFLIQKGTRGWCLAGGSSTVGIDSWTRYGFPYLSGHCEYKQIFEVPNNYSRLILKFSAVSGGIEVFCNGVSLGWRHWPPFEVDLTAHCEPKRNELRVRSVNTIDNILRMNGRPSGLLGDSYLDVY